MCVCLSVGAFTTAACIVCALKMGRLGFSVGAIMQARAGSDDACAPEHNCESLGHSAAGECEKASAGITVGKTFPPVAVRPTAAKTNFATRQRNAQSGKQKSGGEPALGTT